MLITKRTIAVLLTALTAVVIGGCGGGGGGSSAGPTPGSNTSSSLSGVVTDPPISGAMVRLVGDTGETLSRVVTTDGNGRFTLSHDAADLTGARVVATGGQDIQTGYSFQGLTLTAPVAGDTVAVTPVSTLVVQEMTDGLLSLEQARQVVAQRFGLAVDTLLRDPAESAPLQRVSLQITRMAAALRNEGDALARTAAELRNHDGDFGGAADSLSMDLTLPQSARDQLFLLAIEQAELANIDTGGTAGSVIEAANRIAFRHALGRYLSEQDFIDPANDIAWANVEALADALWQANGRRGIPSSGPQIANLVRYAVQHHELDLNTLTDEAFKAPQGLEGDSQIAALARMKVIDHTISLAPGEELGDDNERRLDYFYGSDLSPFYRAEQVLAGVFDDATLDPVYTDIAEGLASVGRLEAAEGVLRAQIFHPQQRATAYRKAGFALLEGGNREQALSFLDTGRNLYDEDMEGRGGAANLERDDASFYYTLSRHYLQAGDPDGAAQAMSFVDAYAEQAAGQPYSSIHGSLLVAWWQIAEAAVEEALAGETSPASAADAVDQLARFTRLTGMQQTTVLCGDNDLFRVMYTARYSEFYARLGLLDEVTRAIGEFEQLRQHECTRQRTELYVSWMASSYGAVDRIADFRQMVADTVDNSSHQQRAYDALVMFESLADARGGDVQAAINRILEANPASAADRIEQLTYKDLSRLTPYLALTLFQENEIAAGRDVLNEAATIAFSNDYWTSVSSNRLINRGCQKVAELRHDFVDVGAGRTEMRECRDRALEHFAGEPTSNRLLAFRQLAEGLANVGLPSDALALLDQAEPLAGAIADVEERGSQRRMLGSLAIELGDIDRGLRLLARSVQDLNSQTKATESEAKAAISDAFDLADRYLLAADAIRAEAGSSGTLDLTAQKQVLVARAQARGLLDGSSGEVTRGALSLNESLTNPSHRATRYRDLITRLAGARAFEAAIGVVENESAGHSNPDRLRMLQSIARGMIQANDFPDTQVASMDLDGDGRPDFFNPLSTEAERSASGLSLDDDMDGDGTPDSVDLTPMCADCETQ